MVTGQVLDDRTEVVPVLAALGVQDDVPVGACEPAEPPVFGPMPQKCADGCHAGAEAGQAR